MTLTDYRNIIKLYIGVILGNTALFSILFALFPMSRDMIMRDGNILDSLTVLIFLVIIVMSLPYLLMMRDRRSQFIYAFIPLIATVILWAEAGIGPGLFDWVKPLYRFVKPLGAVTLLTVSGIFLVVMTMITISLVKFLTQLASFREWMLDNTPFIIFVGGFLMFSLVSIVFDLNVVMRSNQVTGFIEELSEVNAAISIFFCTLFLRDVIHDVRLKTEHTLS